MSLPAFSYSPFERGLRDLGSVDLAALLAVSEGWHVEYKRELHKAGDAAKSLGAFANTYGGWLLYGIDAPGKAGSVPTAFPGIALDDVPRVLELIQRGAADLTDPAPFFETQVVCGPDADTALPRDRAIVIVRIPPGASAPYVHRSGRIYRRVGDASDPREETDRHILDLLWKRSQVARDRWAAIIEQDFTLSKAESEQPVLHLFLTCDRYGDRGTRLDIEFTDFVKLMRDQSPSGGGLPFDNFFPASGGLVARQVSGHDPFDLSLTWRQYRDSTAIVSVPIVHERFDPTFWAHNANSYTQAKSFAKVLDRAGLRDVRILEVSILPYVINAVLLKYRALLASAGIEPAIVVKARLDEIWRCVPFLDLRDYTEFVEEHGPAVVQDADATIPREEQRVLDIGSRKRELSPSDDFETLVDAMIVTGAIFAAIGLELPAEALAAEFGALLQRTSSVAKERAKRRSQ